MRVGGLNLFDSTIQPGETLRRVNTPLIENTVDAIVEELTDYGSRALESDSILSLLCCAGHGLYGSETIL